MGLAGLCFSPWRWCSAGYNMYVSEVEGKCHEMILFPLSCFNTANIAPSFRIRISFNVVKRERESVQGKVTTLPTRTLRTLQFKIQQEYGGKVYKAQGTREKQVKKKEKKQRNTAEVPLTSESPVAAQHRDRGESRHNVSTPNSESV